LWHPASSTAPINAATFTAWVEQSLVPTLKPGDVVVLDNLSSHKDPRARRAIRAVGAHLLFLPPYAAHPAKLRLACWCGRPPFGIVVPD